MKEMTVLFLRREQEVLLAMKKRGFGEGRWNGVGGKVELDESPEEAAIRECREEIMVTPQKLSKVAELTFDEMHLGFRERLFVHVYTCQNWEGAPIETEEMAPKWFNLDAVPYDEMWPDDIFWLPQVLAGKIIRATFQLDQNDLIIAKEVQTVTSL